MKVQEEFVVAGAAGQRLWEFFEQIDRVARCVPGVEEVTVVDADNSRLRVTQALGSDDGDVRHEDADHRP